jgi:hypothetical protein
MVVRELFAKLGFIVDDASLAKANGAMGGVKKVLGGIAVAFAAGAIVKGLKHIVDETAAAARESSKAAQRVGMNRVAYEELAHAADETGTPIESMQTGLKFLNRSLYAASTGNHQLSYAFQKLGVATRDGSGKLRSADAVLMDLADSFKGMRQDDPRKIALSMQLLGRSGNELVPMLSKGSEGLRELRKEAHELGLVFSDEDVAAAKAYGLANRQLDATLEGLKRRIGVALLPLATKMKLAILDWVKANREMIKQGVIAFATSFASALRYLWNAAEPVVTLIRSIVGGIIDFVRSSQEAKVAAVVVGGALFVMFNAPLAAGLLLLGLIEEIWGWVTGKRKTLLEDAFGSWSDLQAKFKDNLIVQTIEGWRIALGNIRDTIRQIKAELGIGGSSGAEKMSADAGSMRKAYEAAGATGFDTQWQLAKDPRFTELTRSGDFSAIAREYGSSGPRAVSPMLVGGSSEAPMPSGGFNFSGSINVPVTVNGSMSKADGDQLAKTVASHVKDALSAEYSTAHAAVAR